MRAVVDSILMGAGEVGRAWLSAWWPLTVATGALLVVAWLGDRALERRVSASLRLLLYATVMVRLALPVGWHSPLGLLPTVGGDTSAGPGAPAPAAAAVAPAAAVATGVPAIAPPAPAVDSPWTADPLVPTPDAPWLGMAAWAGVAYLLVAALLLGRVLWARWQLGRLLRAATPLRGRAGGVTIVRHPRLGPFVAGVWRPRVVLPPAVADAGGEEARALILRHELAHIRRRDPLVTLLLQLLCALAWPLLPVWLAAGRVRALMEIACDERAVGPAGAAQRLRYAELLLALAGAGGGGRWVHVMRFGSPLGARLRGLAVRRRWPRPLQVAAMALAAALAIACAARPGSARDEADGVAVDAADAAAHPGAGAGEGSAGGSGVQRPPAVTGPGSPRVAPRPDRRHAPQLDLWGDGSLWLSTRRGGHTRVDTWRPLEAALREAIADTGEHTLLIHHSQRVPAGRLRQVMARARRAGARDFGVVPFDVVFRRPSAEIPSLDPRQPPVVTRTAYRDPILTITQAGALYLYSERVSPDRLALALARVVESGRSNTLLVSGDEGAIQRASVDVLAAARRAGVGNVAVIR
jgi:biopolymer transport protein ExbD/Zn-dependent protease with chaperone function